MITIASNKEELRQVKHGIKRKKGSVKNKRLIYRTLPMSVLKYEKENKTNLQSNVKKEIKEVKKKKNIGNKGTILWERKTDIGLKSYPERKSKK